MSTGSDQPIGIFDSGVGGLTVAKALTQRLPRESIVYFGDTAHAPWGDKSIAAIQAYSIKICDMLLQHGCKLILIACNSASAVAHELVKAYVGKQALVVDVVEPTIDYLVENFLNKTIGLIGTQQTIQSGVYRKKLAQRKTNIQLKMLATPLLVPLIEEEASDPAILSTVIQSYLSNPILHQVDALVLGCTHYPLIRSLIQEHYGDSALIIDTTDLVARRVEKTLQTHEKLVIDPARLPSRKFYVSDYTLAFSSLARLFFAESVRLHKYPLWE